MKLRHRHPQWEERLSAVVEAWDARDYAPAWGSDCVAFTLAAIEAVSGEILAFDGARPYRSAAGQGRWLKDMGWRNLMDAADACLGERIPVLAAHRGDVVSDGSILGVRIGGGYVAFGEDGMTWLDQRSLVAAWPVGRTD